MIMRHDNTSCAISDSIRKNFARVHQATSERSNGNCTLGD